ncbi:MAG: type IX secretion system sortase PorU [Bacteroidales bacterium]|nr:type IX secretion system sortase PorU [Bacteroidales bacterium]MCF8387301.1 type IX secretion system sortase PorU [Bacteroidales bacterium]MCF8396721.1 type IX secretion system sortase PorU [Bacteroidales bacterium]
MNYRKVLLLLIVLAFHLSLISQDSIRTSCQISWQIDHYELESNEHLSQAIHFKDAIYKQGIFSIPAYQKRIVLPTDRGHAKVEVLNKEFDAIYLGEYEKLNLHSLPEKITSTISTGKTRDDRILNVSLHPLMYDFQTDTLYLLKKFDLNIRLKAVTPEMQSIRDYAENSVLATGNWYKIRLSENGIYKITYNDLTEMGLDVDAINPRNINVYGNGGGMLPESNDTPVYDDLMQNAIFVAGENDNSFDPGDYILFYGQAPGKWYFNPADNTFHENFNVYSDHTYYFITTDMGSGRRIETVDNNSMLSNISINNYNDFLFHKNDDVNILGTGRKWLEPLGNDEFKYSKTIEHLNTSFPVKVKANVVARSFESSSFKLIASGSTISQVLIQKVIEGSLNDFARSKVMNASFDPASNKIDLVLDYIRTHSSGTSWLDYLELNFIRELKQGKAQFLFRSTESVGTNRVAEFNIGEASANLRVWDVTDPIQPREIKGSYSGSTYRFKAETDVLKEFLAYDGSAFLKADFVEKVANQNLHGIPTPEMVVIAYPGFMNAAKRLADFHRNDENMNIFLCTPQEVYNEFSSGAQDVTAIRNFMKMLYDRSDGNEFKYLMLFGDASYDYKDRLPENTNFVPSWESVASYDMINSYVTDDYYGLLDEGEGLNIPVEELDLGIGRIPVRSSQEADAIVDKILHYAGNPENVMRPWRTWVSFIADDEDGNLHVRQAEELAEYVDMEVKNLNIDKIYLDSYTQESTPSGQRYPEVTEKLNNRMEQGALVVNYTGHGGELGLAHEQILSISDINNWTNYDNLPIFITATCEFARYDDPTRTSAGEYVFLNQQGGAIAMFTTARATYAGSNLALNKQFYRKAFEKIEGEYPRLGDILRMSKTAVSTGINKRKYVLLGDPALKMAYPLDSVITTEINGFEVSEVPDTLKALAEVNMKGTVYSCDGYKLEDFNGTVYTTVFDKASRLTTYGQDNNSTPKDFYLRKNIVYKGKTPAQHGEFEFTFIVPKDIAYNYGFGRISMYAAYQGKDGAGYNENIIVGGFSDINAPDTVGPQISLFMNDTSFIEGGITDQDPHLLAFLSDQSGINTVGNGIGHDITAVIDGQNETPYVLNDFYEADLGDYTNGSILYPFLNLPEGEHTLKLKVWDVYNNSSESEIDFVVVKSSDFRIEKLMNFPNPFAHETSFVFEHNQAGEELDVEIQIFSLQGRLVSKIKRKMVTGGYKSAPIKWEGNTVNGAKLKEGFYLYRLIVKNERGEVNEKTAKLILTNY